MAGSGGNSGGLFCVFLLLLLVAMLATASLVLQIFAWNLAMDDSGGRSGQPSVRQIRENLDIFQADNGVGPPIKKILELNKGVYGGGQDRVWIIGIDFENYNNLHYYDVTTGKMGGYLVDMANAVCKAAGENCRIVAHGGRCWETNAVIGARGGPALHSGWLDACVGFSPSLARSLVFDFTESLSPRADVYFYTLPENPGNFNWRDLRGRKIGLLATWYTDEACIARNADKIQGADLDPSQITYYDTNEELYDALESREVDAGFFTAENQDIASRLEIASDKITNCVLGGDAVMIRKNSKFQKWWDPALQTVFNSREYREICKDIDNYYSSFLSGLSSEHVCRSDI